MQVCVCCFLTEICNSSKYCTRRILVCASARALWVNLPTTQTLIFGLNRYECFGHIRSVFRVDDPPFLFVAYFTHGFPLMCPLDKENKMEYPKIQIAPTVTWSYLCIDMGDIIETTTFYEALGHEVFFCPFPTLCHSS